MKTDREKLIGLIDSVRYWGCGTSEEIADYLISKGAVIPVRCKDCKYYGITGDQSCEVHSSTRLEDDYYIVTMEPDDFCGYGERKEE